MLALHPCMTVEAGVHVLPQRGPLCGELSAELQVTCVTISLSSSRPTEACFRGTSGVKKEEKGEPSIIKLKSDDFQTKLKHVARCLMIFKSSRLSL